MPSDASKNKTGKSKPSKPGPDARRSRSRNTTPVSTSTLLAADPPTTPYFATSIARLQIPVLTNLEKVLGNDGSTTHVPSSAKLNVMQEDIKNDVLSPIRERGEVLDRVMRELSKKRKERAEHDRNIDRAKVESEERRHKQKKHKKHDASTDERPLAIGAHEVARQDGVDVHKDISSSISSPVSQAPLSAGTGQPESAESPSDSETDHQPPPAPAVPQYQTFGPDPSKFDDPTVYHIRDVTLGMGDDEKREIYCVAVYPESDLHDRTCGTPPDKDFSSAKPANQVTFNQFTNYIDLYVRPLCEEDIAFLRERGDRMGPFMLPPRGQRHYKDIWAEEDGGMQLDNDDKPPSYEPRGNADQLLNEDLTETDRVSAGPVLSRLLEAMRPERRTDEAAINGETNGILNGDMDLDEPSHSQANGDIPSGGSSIPSATHMLEADAPGFRAPNFPRPDYATMDDRILQELRHIGFMGPDDAPSYQGHYDDEVAARLRYLQAELRRVSVENGAKKARILELTKDRMAQQEYSNIADDLDNQLNQAYLKRNRTIGKGKKVVKRPGGAGGGSHAVTIGAGAVTRPGIGEPIRNLMERRLRWRNEIGPVVDYGRADLPKDSIFGDETMKRLIEREAESWNEVEE